MEDALLVALLPHPGLQAVSQILPRAINSGDDDGGREAAGKECKTVRCWSRGRTPRRLLCVSPFAAVGSPGTRPAYGINPGSGLQADGSVATASRCYDVSMRTTLNLDPEVLQAARNLAEARNISVGAAVSELARRGLDQQRVESAGTFPRFHVPPGARIITLDDVKRLEDEA